MSDNSKKKAKAGDTGPSKDLSARIAQDIQESILAGRLVADDRLPTEADLCDTFGVSRSTVREALKRLAARNLIKTRRGATGGAFVNRLKYSDAYAQHATTATLLLSLNEIDIETACLARFAMERGCAQMSAQNRTSHHLAAMRAEIVKQSQPDLTDQDFCASDVAFHRALVDSAANPVLSWHLAGAVEGMQPLMNMIIYRQRDKDAVVSLHKRIIDALEMRDANAVENLLDALCAQTLEQAKAAKNARQSPPSLLQITP